MTEIEKAKIHSVFKECSSHVKRLQTASFRLEGYFPLLTNNFQDLDDETVLLIDQLIYRFTKLQDAIGHRLFPVIYSVLEGDDTPRPFLDTLHYLEKINIIESVEDWQMLRNLRNNLAHDYPDSVRQTMDTLNILYTTWPLLKKMYLSAEKYLQRFLAD